MNWATEYAETKETKSEWRAHNKRERAAERAKKKALAERDYLYNEWREWHQEQLKEFTNGSYAEAVRELHAFLLVADLNSGDLLIELVKAGPWREADDETQYQLLRMISRAIVQLRERNDLPPFDDALDENLTVFQEIRREIAGW